MKKFSPPFEESGSTCRFRFLLTGLRVAGLLLMCLVTLGAEGQERDLSKRFSLKVENAYISEIFLQIEKQSDISFLYRTRDIEALGKRNFSCTDVELQTIMTRILSGTQLVWGYKDKHITIRPKGDRSAISTADRAGSAEAAPAGGGKSFTFSGRVTDKQRQPLAGVAVTVKNTRAGTATNANGEFRFTANLPESPAPVLLFTFIGMVSQEISFAGQTFTVRMEEDNVSIGNVEVVHTGYQTLSPREVTSSITTVKAEEIMNPSFQSIDQMLESRIPGVTFIQSSGQIGAAPKLRIRGTTTVLGSQEPLWVIDGVIQEDPVNIDPQQLNDLDFVNLLGNAISGVNPEDIEQIDVLKDASATAIYGKRAANGVIVVTTKKGKIGAPTVTYSVTGSISERPAYSDNNVYMMNSKDRVALSRELIEKRQVYPTISSWVGYEGLYRDYMNGSIDFNQFKSQAGYYETLNTDWFKLLTKTSFSHKHTLSLSGGSPALRYYTSLGIDETDGTIKGEKNTRYTASANLTGNYKRFTVRVGMTGYVSDREYVPTDIDVLNYAYNTSRAIPSTNADGSYWYYEREPSSQEGQNTYTKVVPFNILEDIDNSYNTIKGNGLTAQASVDYEIIKPLKISALLAYSFSNSDSETYHGPETSYGRMLRKDYNVPTEQAYYDNTLMPVGGELKTSSTDRDSYTVRLSAVYDQLFGADDQHKVTATLGGEIGSTTYNTLAETYRGYVPERGKTMSGVDLSKYAAYSNWTQSEAAMGVRTTQLNNSVSAFLTTGYGYKEHFYASLNARIDFSNEFGSRANEKFFPIWAVSARWNLNKSVVRNVKWINELALRASFGYQGNVPSVPTRLIIKKGALNQYFGEYSSTIYKYPNPNLKWEKTASTNVAVDFSLFNRKVTGTFEYYYRRTTDAYVNEAVSEVNGLTSYTVNRGTLENKGYDITLNFTPINNITNVNGEYKGFKWRCDPQLGQVLNKLLDKVTATNNKTLKEDDEIYYTDYLNGSTPVKGRPVNGFYSYRFGGLSSVDGRPTFKGLAETTVIDGVEVSTASILAAYGTNQERILSIMDYSGSRTPTLQGGLNNTFSYNNFSLGINLTYSLGSKIRLLRLYPNVSTENGTIAPQPAENVRQEFLSRWRNPGDERFTNVPGIVSYKDFSGTMSPWWLTYVDSAAGINLKNVRPISGSLWEMYDYSDLRVVSGNYLKIQSISLRYNLPRKFCESISLKSAYVSFIGTNLYTFCSSKLKGQDPTTQSGSSTTLNMSIRPTYSFTLNISF